MNRISKKSIKDLKKSNKIVHVITGLDRGGSAEVVLELLQALSVRGWNVILISGKTDNPQLDLSKYQKEKGIKISVPSIPIEEVDKEVERILGVI